MMVVSEHKYTTEMFIESFIFSFKRHCCRCSPALIPPSELMAKLKMNEFVGHAPNVMGWRANQVT